MFEQTLFFSPLILQLIIGIIWLLFFYPVFSSVPAPLCPVSVSVSVCVCGVCVWCGVCVCVCVWCVCVVCVCVWCVFIFPVMFWTFGLCLKSAGVKPQKEFLLDSLVLWWGHWLDAQSDPIHLIGGIEWHGKTSVLATRINQSVVSAF